MPARALWYAVAALMVAGIPLLVYLLFGAPELAAPSQWADVESGIADGVLPAGYIVNIISGLFLVAWFCGLGLLVATLTGRMPTGGTADEEATAMTGFAPDGQDADPDFEPDITAGASDLEASMPADSRELAPDRSLDREPGTEPGTDPDEPWYRQGPPLFDEPFSDEYPRVVVPPDDATPDEPPDDPAWPAGAGTPESPITDDGITDAEIVSEPAAAPADDPPMIVPVRAYYFTRAEDTLRSIAAQFLQTPKRWEELRGLNAASPGVAGMGPDTLLPVGTALALPGDPLPWGKPDPVYLWTLAEKFLFTAWGREPAPEEVVPFWRGLTSGSQLGTGTASDLPLRLAAATAEFPAAETGMPVPPTPEPEPPTQEPETPTQQEEPPAREPEALTPEPEPPTHETVEAPTPEPITAYDSPEDAPTQEREPATQPEAPTQEQITAYDSPEPPPTYERPAYESPVPTDYESPAPPTHEPPPPTYESPVPPTHEPPPPAYESPVPPSHEPPPTYEPEPPAAYDSPVPPSHEPPPAAYDSPVPPSHEPPPAYDSPVPPSHEPPPAYDSPVPPSHEPPPAYEPEPPAAYDSPVPPSHEPPPPMARQPGEVDLGPIEPEMPYVEAEAPPMPSFLPSLTGADTAAAAAPEAQAVASSNRSLAGTAIGDAMMLWQLSRIRRRGSRRDGIDPMEESLKQSARVDSLNLIEAAMRHLRAVTVGQLREKPSVLAVRVGTYGFEVLLNRPVQAPDGWRAASGGYVLELPQGVTADDLDTAGQGPTLCPALVPVGDTVEGPLLLNIEEIGCLIVSGPASPSVNLLNAVVGTLGSSPLAADIRIITVGVDTPVGVPGWDNVHSTSFDSPQLEELISNAHTGRGALLDVLAVGPGNDLLIQRAGQVASTPESRLALVGVTSSATARWPWRIHVDETTTAVVHPIACTMAAAQAMAPAMSDLLSEASDLSLLAPPRF